MNTENNSIILNNNKQVERTLLGELAERSGSGSGSRFTTSHCPVVIGNDGNDSALNLCYSNGRITTATSSTAAGSDNVVTSINFLPDEILSSITDYLKLNEKAAFSAVCKSWEKVAFSNTTKLTFHPDCIGSSNIDGALQFVSSRVNRLQSVTIAIPHSKLIPSLSVWTGTPPTKFAGASLRAFLETCSPLQAIRIVFEQGCEHEVRAITSHGALDLATLARHESLRVFDLNYVVFPNVEALNGLLQHWRKNTTHPLQVLNLNMITLGESSMDLRPWENGLSTLIQSIGNLTTLKKLGLAHWRLQDGHLPCVLHQLRDLRCLNLRGMMDVEAIAAGGPGFLTDAALDIIAVCCPKLQKLDIAYNQRITIHGVQRLLRSCSELRELDVSGTRIGPEHLAEISFASNRLMLLHCTFNEAPFERFGNTHNRQVYDATMASGGRLIIHELYVGLVEVSPPLVGDALMVREDTLKIIGGVLKRTREPEIRNEWEPLLGA